MPIYRAGKKGVLIAYENLPIVAAKLRQASYFGAVLTNSKCEVLVIMDEFSVAGGF